MGLVILAALGFYLLISVVVVVLIVRAAKRRGKSPWLRGTVAGVIMYSLVFWDLIPTIVVHRYYCETQAGLSIHKTAAQWRAENPEVAGLPVPPKFPPPPLTRVGGMNNYVDSYMLNQRLKVAMKKNGPFFLHRWRHEQNLVDTESGRVLMENVDFSTGYLPDGQTWQAVKFWIISAQCGDGGRRASEFWQILDSFKGPYE